MKLEILEKSDERMKVVISEATPALVNAIRRTMMCDVPTLAIENVDFHLGQIVDDAANKDYESITPFFNEMIAQRLGLIPLPTDLSTMNMRGECRCGGEGCSFCTVLYKLDKRGPCVVYSGDLIPLGDMKFAPRMDLIPIVKLGDTQAVLIYATAELGTGAQHAKWSPVSGIGYKYYPEITVNNARIKDALACVESCPRKVFDATKEGVVVARPLDCNLCRRCEEVCGSDAVSVSADETRIVFKFESDGCMPAEEIFLYALKRLQERLADLEKSLPAR